VADVVEAAATPASFGDAGVVSAIAVHSPSRKRP